MIGSLKLLNRMVFGAPRYWKRRLMLVDIKAGKHFYPRPYFYAARGFRIRIGNDVHMGRNAHIACNLEMGNDVLVASYVAFVGGDHRIDNIGDTLIRKSGRKHEEPAIIEDNVWIGHGCTVFAGVRMKSGSVLAAGSVLNKNVGENEIWAGVPAKFLRKRKMNVSQV